MLLLLLSQVESRAERERLPLYKVIPAARPEELTPAKGYPDPRLHRSWDRSHGSDYNTRFSLLDQIDQTNVSKLRVAWTYRSGDLKLEWNDNIQSNPIVVDGVMYAPTMGRHVVALDAASGRERWRFSPGARPAFRGLTYFRGNDKISPRLLFGAGDFLWALEPKTGKPVAGFGDGGSVRSGEFRVAPVVHGDSIIVAGYLKDVFAFDLSTGKPGWVFHTLPRRGEFGYEPGNETFSYGANCWGGIALDPERGIVYIATGGIKPNFEGASHPGRRLFGNSVVAIDARTGKRVWHFQEIPHDLWDLDIPSPPVLVTVKRHGKMVDAVAAVSKVGNTLLLDRTNGKPLFPFRLRRAPTSTVPGERTWPYQPDLDLPQPFARQEFTIDDVTNISPEAHEYVLNKVRAMTFGWFRPGELGRANIQYGLLGGGEWTGASFDPRTGLFYVTANEIPSFITLVPAGARVKRDKNHTPTAGERHYVAFCASCHSEDRTGIGMGPPLLALGLRYKDKDVVDLLKTGRNGMPAAPPMTETQQTELLDFLFDRDRPPPPPPKKGEPPRYVFLGFPRLFDQEGYLGSKPPWGTLNAIDLSTGRIVWKRPLGEHEELTRRGIPKTGTLNMGGATATAGGLVFVSGTKDDLIRAFDSASGDELWRHKLPFRGTAAPTVYEVSGKQYVVIAATGGGKLGPPLGDAYVAFTLP
jgi:quinoprotein glucose dehydrogenase